MSGVAMGPFHPPRLPCIAARARDAGGGRGARGQERKQPHGAMGVAARSEARV